VKRNIDLATVVCIISGFVSDSEHR